MMPSTWSSTFLFDAANATERERKIVAIGATRDPARQTTAFQTRILFFAKLPAVTEKGISLLSHEYYFPMVALRRQTLPYLPIYDRVKQQTYVCEGGREGGSGRCYKLVMLLETKTSGQNFFVLLEIYSSYTDVLVFMLVSWMLSRLTFLTHVFDM